ncbi:MAG: hypothetical protein JOY99_06640, partial [Sphingomonadaceae bacterium]|nr:hypothetical protein [Sphingomonadaceae bacterium]
MTGAAPPSATDIAAALLTGISGTHRAVVEATEPGRIAGTAFLDPSLAPAGAGEWRLLVEEGATVA